MAFAASARLSLCASCSCGAELGLICAHFNGHLAAAAAAPLCDGCGRFRQPAPHHLKRVGLCATASFGRFFFFFCSSAASPLASSNFFFPTSGLACSAAEARRASETCERLNSNSMNTCTGISYLSLVRTQSCIKTTWQFITLSAPRVSARVCLCVSSRASTPRATARLRKDSEQVCLLSTLTLPHLSRRRRRRQRPCRAAVATRPKLGEFPSCASEAAAAALVAVSAIK